MANSTKTRFMQAAIDESKKGVRNNHGGPFGAVIVRSGKIVAKAHNTVLLSKDPTSHAEINAIRQASRKRGSFDLSGCELYTTCEPCPMCLAAIYWARIDKMYYGCTRDDAAKIGFDDARFYELICGRSIKGKLPSKKMGRKECLKAFGLWSDKKDKVRY